MHAETPNSAVVLGLRQATYTFEAVSELAKETDFTKRCVYTLNPCKFYVQYLGYQKERVGG